MACRKFLPLYCAQGNGERESEKEGGREGAPYRGQEIQSIEQTSRDVLRCLQMK